MTGVGRILAVLVMAMLPGPAHPAAAAPASWAWGDGPGAVAGVVSRAATGGRAVSGCRAVSGVRRVEPGAVRGESARPRRVGGRVVEPVGRAGGRRAEGSPPYGAGGRSVEGPPVRRAGGPGVGVSAGRWTGSWESAPSGAAAALPGAAVRNVVHLSVGGSAVRVRLSNRFGRGPLRLGAVTVALRAAGPGALPGTLRVATFGGARAVTVPPGEDTVTDPVPLPVRPAADLLVSVATPGDDGPATFHQTALQTSYIAPQGAGRAADEDGAAYTTMVGCWYYVTGVDVLGPATGSVVAFGDSLTDGNGSTPDTNHRWPDRLADRLRTDRLGVLNAGISGNRLLRDGAGPSALARLDADAPDRTGVRVLVVLEGINDIKGFPAADDVSAYAAAYRTLVARAHARGVRVVGVTLTPYRGFPAYTAAREAVRRRVNAFIRTGGAFDAVADADAALRDPADPTRLRPAYDPGDHLHFNDTGMAKLADLVLRALHRVTVRGGSAVG